MKRCILLLVLVLSLQPVLAQTRSASGVVDDYGVKIVVKDGIAFWDGYLARVLVFPFKLSAAHLRQVKDPIKRRKMLKGRSYADIRFNVGKSKDIPLGYSMYIYDEKGFRRSNGGGVQGRGVVKVFSGDIARNPRCNFNVAVGVKKINFKYSGPVYPWEGRHYKTVKD